MNKLFNYILLWFVSICIVILIIKNGINIEICLMIMIVIEGFYICQLESKLKSKNEKIININIKSLYAAPEKESDKVEIFDTGKKEPLFTKDII